MNRNQIAIDKFPVSLVFAVNFEIDKFKLTANFEGGIPGDA
jgi:hypothetical protein